MQCLAHALRLPSAHCTFIPPPQLRVYGSPVFTYRNAVPGRPVRASSVWSDALNAAQAADELLDHMWSTAGTDPQPFWQVDLGAASRVTSVELVARQDDCDQPDCRRCGRCMGE